MYEDILGRPASAPEKKMLDAGFVPELRFGDKVKISGSWKLGNPVTGAIDGVVLFAIPQLPGAPGRQLAWAFRIEGMQEFLPQSVLQRVKD